MRTHVDLHLWGSPRLATVARTTEGRVAVEIDEGPADSPAAVHGTPEQIEAFAAALLEGLRRARNLPGRTMPAVPGERVEQREDGVTVVRPVTWPPVGAVAGEECPRCNGRGWTEGMARDCKVCLRCGGTGRVAEVTANARADA